MKKSQELTSRERALLDAWSDYHRPPADDAFEARVLDAVHAAAHSPCVLALDLDPCLTEADEAEAADVLTSQESCAARNNVAPSTRPRGRSDR